MKTDPYSMSRKDRDAERVDNILGRKSGGRVKNEDEGTNIHIEINGNPKGEQTADMPVPMPPPPMPMPPPAPPMGGLGGLGGMGAKPPLPGIPGAGPGGGAVALKRGGRAQASGSGNPPNSASDADSMSGMRRRASGGRAKAPAGPSIQLQEGGAGGGMGRLEKTKDARRHK